MKDSQPPSETTPTQSHALANADHEEVGAVQVAHSEPEVKDLGWDETAPASLVGGLSNDELWTLIRRFNKVHIPSPLPLPFVPCHSIHRLTQGGVWYL